MGMPQSSAHSLGNLAKEALLRILVEWDQVKTWEVGLVDRLICLAFAANSPPKLIIEREKWYKELPLRSSSLPTSLIALPASSLENITSG